MAVNSRALTTTTEVWDYLGMDQGEDLRTIEALIDAMSDKIERICGRRFAAAEYRQWLSASGERELQLRHWPIIHVHRVAVGSANGLSVTYSGSAIRATAGIEYDENAGTHVMRLVSIAADGTVTTTELDLVSTYPTNSTLATAVTAVSEWTGTLLNDELSANLHVLGAQDADERTVNFTYPDEDAIGYQVDYRRGMLRKSMASYSAWGLAPGRWTPGVGNILVQYRAGYETIPDDVSQLCMELVAEQYRRTRRLPNSIRDETENVQAPLQTEEEIRDRLSSYREVA